MKKKKKNFKINSPIKILKVLAISILALIITSSNNNAQANFFNKFKKGFYFEKYKTAKEAKDALLELHPIGSDVDGLVKTLERAGVKVKEDEILKYRKFKKYNSWWDMGIVKIYYYRYNGASNILNPIIWAGNIDIDKNNKIINFGLSKQYSGL